MTVNVVHHDKWRRAQRSARGQNCVIPMWTPHCGSREARSIKMLSDFAAVRMIFGKKCKNAKLWDLHTGRMDVSLCGSLCKVKILFNWARFLVHPQKCVKTQNFGTPTRGVRMCPPAGVFAEPGSSVIERFFGTSTRTCKNAKLQSLHNR